jgi:hypothetical protein
VLMLFLFINAFIILMEVLSAVTSRGEKTSILYSVYQKKVMELS